MSDLRDLNVPELEPIWLDSSPVTLALVAKLDEVDAGIRARESSELSRETAA